MQSRYSINQKQSLIDQLEFKQNSKKEYELEEEKRFKNFLIIMVASYCHNIIVNSDSFLSCKEKIIQS